MGGPPREPRWTTPVPWIPCLMPFTRAEGVTARGARTAVGPEFGFVVMVVGGDRPRVLPPKASGGWQPGAADTLPNAAWLAMLTLPAKLPEVVRAMAFGFRDVAAAELILFRPTFIDMAPPTMAVVGAGELPRTAGLGGNAAGECP